MQILIAAILVCFLASTSFAAEPTQTDEQKTLYFIGHILSRNVSVFNFTPAEWEIVKQGLTDAIAGKPLDLDFNAYNDKVEQLAQARIKAQKEKQASMGKEFLDKAGKESGAIRTESDLVFLSLKEGTGATPKAADTVKVNYRGTLIDGKEFDNSYKRGEPVEFKLDSVIKCWTEGLQKMKVGGKAKLVCPAAIAYGEQGAGGVIPPDATLIFEVELLDIKK
jgi:FKBP-type peptidyl-prolyl cis-trans isomerase FkpA